MVDDVLTRVLAVWGALVSTALGVIKVIEYSKDRAIVRVTLAPDMKAFPPTSAYGTMTLLNVKVANVGRRPTSITHVSVLLPRGSTHKYVLCADPLTATYPVELSENKAHLFVFNQDPLMKEYDLTPSRLVARVDDVAGRSYWSHGRLARMWKLGRLG